MFDGIAEALPPDKVADAVGGGALAVAVPVCVTVGPSEAVRPRRCDAVRSALSVAVGEAVANSVADNPAVPLSVALVDSDTVATKVGESVSVPTEAVGLEVRELVGVPWYVATDLVGVGASFDALAEDVPLGVAAGVGYDSEGLPVATCVNVRGVFIDGVAVGDAVIASAGVLVSLCVAVTVGDGSGSTAQIRSIAPCGSV